MVAPYVITETDMPEPFVRVYMCTVSPLSTPNSLLVTALLLLLLKGGSGVMDPDRIRSCKAWMCVGVVP
jgi:hypothetical protein